MDDMPGTETAELIFIAAMMLLILVISFAAVYFFVRTYRKEMADKESRRATEREDANAIGAAVLTMEAKEDDAS